MSETPRRSDRINKGRTGKFEDFVIEEFPKTPQQKETTQSKSSATKSVPSATTSAVTSAAASGTSASTSHTRSDPVLDGLKKSFSKKIDEMNTQFQKQLQDMQNAMLNNQRAMQATFQNSMQATITGIRAELAGLVENTTSNTTESSGSSQDAHIVHHAERQNSSMSTQSTANRNKKIYPLPQFTGQPEEWQIFYESFTSTTEEFEYSNLHNIMRLRDALRGKALETVESLLANSNNVEDIIETLKEMFGRPDQLIKSQIEKVRLISPFSDNNLPALISFANNVNNMANFLKNAKGQHHLANPMLLMELVNKLPNSRKMQWAEKVLTFDEIPTILQFSKWLNNLRKLANIVADTMPSSSDSSRINQPRHLKPTPSHPAQPKRVLSTFKSYACYACSDENCKSVAQCTTFLQMTVPQRWKKVKEAVACFECLKNGHQTSKCFGKKQCQINNCPKFHNCLLHDENLQDLVVLPGKIIIMAEITATQTIKPDRL